MKNGIIVIFHPESQGKGASFRDCVIALRRETKFFDNPESALVNIDADALDLTRGKIVGLAEEMRKRKVPMLLGNHVEKANNRNYFFGNFESKTGFRAISSVALNPMINPKHPRHKRWKYVFPREFGMDLALNLLVFHREYAAVDDPFLYFHTSIPVEKKLFLNICLLIGTKENQFKRHIEGLS